MWRHSNITSNIRLHTIDMRLPIIRKAPLLNPASSFAAYSSAIDKPRPMPLPPKQQAEYDELQKAGQQRLDSLSAHPDARKLKHQEFKGERNPVTGEVNGPKTDPLKYKTDWSYGGRVTDF